MRDHEECQDCRLGWEKTAVDHFCAVGRKEYDDMNVDARQKLSLTQIRFNVRRLQKMVIT